MAKAVVKLFHNPANAARAMDDLAVQGYKAEEIGVLLRPKEKEQLGPRVGKASRVELPQVGEVIAAGPPAQGLSQAGEEPAKALMEALDISQEALDFYQFGLTSGSVLLSVHSEAERLALAAHILRSADVLRQEVEATSPGFVLASRRSATDPLDEKMTGDFRRY